MSKLKITAILSIIALLLLGGRLFFRPEPVTDIGYGGMKLKPSSQITQFGSAMKSYIYSFFTNNHLSFLDDTLTKVDFLFPDDPRYTAYKSKYKPNGVDGGIFFVDKRIALYTFPPGHTMSFSALEPPEKFYFTLGNRVTGQDTNLPELMMVAVMKRENCSEVNIGFALSKDGNIPNLTVSINLTPNTEPVAEKDIATLPLFAGCYEGLDGKFYYTQTLISR
jgi:hypothetical protein